MGSGNHVFWVLYHIPSSGCVASLSGIVQKGERVRDFALLKWYGIYQDLTEDKMSEKAQI